MSSTIELIFISDTHGLHEEFEIPEADFIIHCGDISPRGRRHEVEDFAKWFSLLPHKYKIMIPGNHDLLFEKEEENAREMIESRGIICLINQAFKAEGISFWGSPISPWFNNWAFNRYRGSDIERYWNMIPENTDILITHGPPSYVKNLSKVIRTYEDVGCEDLYKAIKRINPKISAFGHIHEGRGIYRDDKTTYINCSLLNRNYEPVYQPIRVKFSRGKFSIHRQDTKK